MRISNTMNSLIRTITGITGCRTPFGLHRIAQPASKHFLAMLDDAFHLTCCYSGNGFETVIARAPQYLQDHPHWTIRSEILLALGDAYRDRIGGCEWSQWRPFQ